MAVSELTTGLRGHACCHRIRGGGAGASPEKLSSDSGWNPTRAESSGIIRSSRPRSEKSVAHATAVLAEQHGA